VRACIAAGSKLRSRPRLGQSGPLNGQHYSIRRDYSTPAAQRPPDAKKQQKTPANKGHFPIHLGPLPDHCRTPSPATSLQHAPRRQPQTWQGASNPGQAKGLGSVATAPSAHGHPVHPPQYCYGGRGHPSTPSARLLAGAPPRWLQPTHCPRARAGGVTMKVKERGSERRGSTIATQPPGGGGRRKATSPEVTKVQGLPPGYLEACFASFSRETVQPVGEPWAIIPAGASNNRAASCSSSGRQSRPGRVARCRSRRRERP